MAKQNHVHWCPVCNEHPKCEIPKCKLRAGITAYCRPCIASGAALKFDTMRREQYPNRSQHYTAMLNAYDALEGFY